MRAGKGQRRLLMAYAVVVLLLLLFPPYVQEDHLGARTSLGHGFIFSPPTWSGGTRRAGTIDGSVLALHLAGVSLIAGALLGTPEGTILNGVAIIAFFGGVTLSWGR
jgi:hypothetical protein